MPDYRYRLTFETVAPTRLAPYCNADPMVYSNTTQTVPNCQIPDEDWHEVVRDAAALDDLLDQYRTLKEWSNEDRDFVRNPRIDRMALSKWEAVDV